MALAKTTLEQWAVLAAVVDQGGFAQAAEALHRSQSAISYAVARLQQALDLPLLAIEGRKAVLTPHGETLLRRARVLLRDLETLERVARRLRQGWEPKLSLVVDPARAPAEHRRGAANALSAHTTAACRRGVVRRRGNDYRG